MANGPRYRGYGYGHDEMLLTPVTLQVCSPHPGPAAPAFARWTTSPRRVADGAKLRSMRIASHRITPFVMLFLFFFFFFFRPRPVSLCRAKPICSQPTSAPWRNPTSSVRPHLLFHGACPSVAPRCAPPKVVLPHGRRACGRAAGCGTSGRLQSVNQTAPFRLARWGPSRRAPAQPKSGLLLHESGLWPPLLLLGGAWA